MKQTVNVHDFRKAFFDYERGDNFSYEGMAALFDYLEQLEEDTGEEMEIDVISLCCDFTEWDSLEEFNEYYGGKSCETLEEVAELTRVIDVNGTRFITQAF